MSENVERLVKELRKNDLSLRRKKEILNLLQDMYDEAEREKDTYGNQSLGEDFFSVAKSIMRDGKSLPPFILDTERLRNLLVRLESYGLLEQQLLHDDGMEIIDSLMCNDDPMSESLVMTITGAISEYRTWERGVERWGSEEEEKQLSHMNAITSVIVDWTTRALARLGEHDSEYRNNSLLYRNAFDTDSDGVRNDVKNMINSNFSMQNIGRRYHDALNHGFEDLKGDGYPCITRPVTVLNALIRPSRNPRTPLDSQKAQGIQAISRTDTNDWDSLPSLFLTMDDAQNSSSDLLLESLKIAYRDYGGIREQFDKGLYIRTCPASPRPGALENRTVHSPRSMLEAIKELSDGMIDPESPFHDPNGSLCIMPKIHSVCSMVMPNGHNTMTVGPSHNSVTAASGSNLVISLYPGFAHSMQLTVESMQIDDGLEHHELEMIWPYAGSSNTVHKQTQVTPAEVYERSQVSGANYNSRAYLVQVRGLHGDKQEVAEAPSVSYQEETIFAVRGNVPSGHVKQLHSMNVGKGTLEDCLLLEQLIERDEIPDGFVIYVPSGTDHCHAAGVALTAQLPIVYGQSHEHDGVVWAEVKPGWVICLPEHADMHAIETESYQASQYSEYFTMGYEDGDRWWNYQNITLSQFFHEHMQGAKQDPRLVAYLAGAYGAWVNKATLAVAMGEARHAYLGQNDLFYPKHGLIHLLGTTFLGGHFVDTEEGPAYIGDYDYQGRDNYYRTLINREIGMENTLLLLRGYQTVFDECEWSDSYGGSKYAKTMDLAIEFCERYGEFLNYGTGPRYRMMLSALNELESAQHNTGWFFNKFTTKLYMDVGTSGHSSLVSIPQQFIIASAHQHRFYKRMGETEKIWDGYLSDKSWKAKAVYPRTTKMLYTEDLRRLFQRGMENLIYADQDDILVDVFLSDERDVFQTAIQNMQQDGYCSECDDDTCGCVKSRHYHQRGYCTSPECVRSGCIQNTLIHTHTITMGDLVDWAFSTQAISLYENSSDAVGRTHHQYILPNGWWYSSNPALDPSTDTKALLNSLNKIPPSDSHPSWYDENATLFTAMPETATPTQPDGHTASQISHIPVTGWEGANEISVISFPEHIKENSVLTNVRGRTLRHSDGTWDHSIADIHEEISSMSALKEAWDDADSLFCIDGLVHDLRVMALEAVNSMSEEEYIELLFTLGDAAKDWRLNPSHKGYLPPRKQSLYQFPTMGLNDECLTLLHHCSRFGQAVQDISYGGGLFICKTETVPQPRITTEPPSWYVPLQIDSPVSVMVTFHALLISTGKYKSVRKMPIRDICLDDYTLDNVVDIDYIDSYFRSWLDASTKHNAKQILLQLLARRNKNEKENE